MILIFLISILIIFNFLFVLYFEKISSYLKIYDSPDGLRKLHSGNVPLLGGLIFFLNILIFLIYSFFLNDFTFLIYDKNLEIKFFFWGILIFFLIGLFDDKFNLNPLIKFTITIIIIYCMIYFNETLILRTIDLSFLSKTFDLNQFSIPITILCFLLFLNAFNMFDGINLQSGLYTIIIFTFFLSNGIFFTFSLVILISSFVFCVLNFKNKVFMGDSGTYLMSFVISCIFVQSYNNGLINYADKVFLFMMIPGLDLVRLFFVRVFNGRHPFYPDRNHLHHLLLKKYGYGLTICIILFLLILPIFLNILITNLFSIIIGFFIYVLLILYLVLNRENVSNKY